MYSMVLWMKNKSYSVVLTDQIVGDRKVGCITYCKHADKLYEAKLLRSSDDIKELYALKVTDDGFLREFSTSTKALTTSDTVDQMIDSSKEEKKGKKKAKSAVKGEVLLPVYKVQKGSVDKSSCSKNASPGCTVSNKPTCGDSNRRSNPSLKKTTKNPAISSTKPVTSRCSVSSVKSPCKTPANSASTSTRKITFLKQASPVKIQTPPRSTRRTRSAIHTKVSVMDDGDTAAGEDTKDDDNDIKEKVDYTWGTGDTQESDKIIEEDGTKEDGSITVDDYTQEEKNDIRDFSRSTPADVATDPFSPTDQLFPTDQPPKASPEVLKYLESFVDWLKTGNRHSATNQAVPAKNTDNELSSVQGTLKIQLLPGYPKAMIDRRRRNVITKLYKSQPTKMAVNLLRAILPKEELKLLNARGTKSRGGVGGDILDAIEEYVTLHCSSVDVKKSKLTKAFNNALMELRRPARLRRVEGDDIESPNPEPPQESGKNSKSAEDAMGNFKQPANEAVKKPTKAAGKKSKPTEEAEKNSKAQQTSKTQTKADEDEDENRRRADILRKLQANAPWHTDPPYQGTSPWKVSPLRCTAFVTSLSESPPTHVSRRVLNFEAL